VTSINARRRKGRGVPDVAGLAEAAYRIRVPGGYVEAHGGTSAVAPLWAGLVAQLNQRLGAGSAGYLNPLLYESVAPTGFHPIVDGTNGGYHARDGWDACTGLGSPIGGRLLRALTS
jgi:kumamolisin